MSNNIIDKQCDEIITMITRVLDAYDECYDTDDKSIPEIDLAEFNYSQAREAIISKFIALEAELEELRAYSDGYAPEEKLPEDGKLVLAVSSAFGFRTVVFQKNLFDEGHGGIGFGVSNCVRWYPLPPMEGGEE